MANTYFQFKQFTVHQEHSAMKVCTDACLFGAWVANEKNIKNAKYILDIGTGTGLLSLMLAQKLYSHSNIAQPTKMVAVEIEPGAATEAANNFTSSPWGNHIQILNTSIQSFSVNLLNEATNKSQLFDYIITNPPFFEGDLPSPNVNINLASHSMALPWTQLIESVEALLSPNGFYYVLIPALRAYTMQKLAAQKGLQLAEEVVVYNSIKQKPFRAIQKFIKSDESIKDIKRSNFNIKEADNSYSKQFIELLSPYYLHL